MVDLCFCIDKLVDKRLVDKISSSSTLESLCTESE